MAFHNSRYATKYEVAAINRATGERIFVAIAGGSRSRRTLQTVLFRALSHDGDTRLARVSAMTGIAPADWQWDKKASNGVVAGDWSIRFSGRTALEVDQQGEGNSIYKPKGHNTK